MKQRFGAFATMGFVALWAFPGTLQAQFEAEPAIKVKLSVQVYNWANVPAGILQRGQAVAGRIFEEAGVELKWKECPCDTGEPTALSIRIIPTLFGSTTSSFRSDHLGFAAATEDGGVLASVFYDRIESLGKGGDLSKLLGLATVHELGHLLLGSRAHTEDGIMRPRWTRQLLRQPHRDHFRFSAEQSETIRQRISKW